MPEPVADASIRERMVVMAARVMGKLGLNRLVYSAGARAFAKRFFLSRSAQPRLRQIVSGLGKGLFLQVLPGTPQAYWMGIHETEVLDVFQKYLKPGMVAYDCGANIGYLSVIMARLVGPAGRVFAFEPSPDNLVSLKVAAEANAFRQMTVVPAAIWSEASTMRFCVNPPQGGQVNDHIEGVFGKEADARQHIEIAALSIDEFVYGQGNPAPDFLKLDVEGAEGKAMAGAERVLTEKRPVLLLEIHGEPGREVWTILQRQRYVCRQVGTGEVPQSVDEFAVWIRQFVATPAEAGS